MNFVFLFAYMALSISMTGDWWSLPTYSNNSKNEILIESRNFFILHFMALSSAWSNITFPDCCCRETSCYVAENIKANQRNDKKQDAIKTNIHWCKTRLKKLEKWLADWPRRCTIVNQPSVGHQKSLLKENSATMKYLLCHNHWLSVSPTILDLVCPPSLGCEATSVPTDELKNRFKGSWWGIHFICFTLLKGMSDIRLFLKNI